VHTILTIILKYNKAKAQYKNNKRRNLVDNEANEKYNSK
jgi:hypothetical protein